MTANVSPHIKWDLLPLETTKECPTFFALYLAISSELMRPSGMQKASGPGRPSDHVDVRTWRVVNLELYCSPMFPYWFRSCV